MLRATTKKEAEKLLLDEPKDKFYNPRWSKGGRKAESDDDDSDDEDSDDDPSSGT